MQTKRGGVMDDSRANAIVLPLSRAGSGASTSVRPPRAWLKPNTLTEVPYEICPERAAAVLWMFVASASGLSDVKIAERIPKRFEPWSQSGKWNRVAIKRVLTDRTVRGGKIAGRLFPPIVEPRLFEEAEEARKERRRIARGRKDRNLINVFSGLIKCECCEQPMRYRSNSMEGGILVCKNEKLCPAFDVPWLYRDFEASFDTVASKSQRRGAARAPLDEKAAIGFEIQFLRHQRAEKEKELARLKSQIAEIQSKIAEKRKEKSNIKKSTIARSRPEQSRLSAAKADKLIDDERDWQHARITARMREVIYDVLMAPDGTKPRLAERIKLAKTRIKITPPTMEEAFISGIEWLKDHPFFRVRFKDGNVLLIVPNRRNPRRLDVWDEEDGPKPSSEGDAVNSAASRESSKGGLPEAKVITVMRHDARPQSFSITTYGPGGVPSATA